MFTALALAAILVTNPYSCPPDQPWAMPSGSEAAPYVCTAYDPGEQLPTFTKQPPAVHPAPHHAPVRHHHAKPKHHAPAKRHHPKGHHAA